MGENAKLHLVSTNKPNRSPVSDFIAQDTDGRAPGRTGQQGVSRRVDKVRPGEGRVTVKPRAGQQVAPGTSGPPSHLLQPPLHRNLQEAFCPPGEQPHV